MAHIHRSFPAAAAVAFFFILSIVSPCAKAASPQAPAGLRCDLLAHPEQTVITTAAPEFDWIYNSSFQDDAQTGYRILVSTSEAGASQRTGNMWDSSLVKSSDSINVLYRGKKLLANTDYYWCVQTADSGGKVGPFSPIQHFRTDSKLDQPSHSLWSDSAGHPAGGQIFDDAL